MTDSETMRSSCCSRSPSPIVWLRLLRIPAVLDKAVMPFLISAPLCSDTLTSWLKQAVGLGDMKNIPKLESAVHNKTDRFQLTRTEQMKSEAEVGDFTSLNCVGL